MNSTSFIALIFSLVYLGMAIGRIPMLRVDRTGIALLGLIALLATQSMSMTAAGAAVDVPTLALLFALMIVSAQFEQAGFYGWVADRISLSASSPRLLLALLIAATGLLSAILTNDVVVFALTPPICVAIKRLQVDGRPYLIALAASANAGSAATLIGNPQNILIGQAGDLAFWTYSAIAIIPTLVSLLVIYGTILLLWPLPGQDVYPVEGASELDRFQLYKAIAAIALLGGLFLTELPREISALCVAGLLLVSRRLSSREMIGAVDWHLLLLFTCLFAITAAFEQTGIANGWLHQLTTAGFGPERLTMLVPATLIGSNTIGNVPAVILLTTLVPDLGSGTLAALALLSTFSGNLLLTGSMCNIIVAELAASHGIKLGFADFARAGLLMTIPAIAVTAAWLWALGLVPL